MSQTTFRSLQGRHEALLQKQQNLSQEDQEDFSKEVKAHIEEAKRGGSYISSTRERDQIRANLRYWANYIYSIEKTFPDTELAPSSIESRPFLLTTIGVMTIILLGIAVLTGVIFAWRTSPTSSGDPATETALHLMTPTSVSQTQTIQTSEPALATENPTLESSGFNIILLNPANGSSITPNIEFRGTFENLKPDWTIHVLFIKGDKFFPVKEFYSIPDPPASHEWIIQTTLMEGPEEMSKAQSYSVVLAISLDDASKQLLLDSSETGIDLNSLPPTVITFQDTSRVIYRDPYTAIQETRLVYSFFDGTSYDLYTSDPDGRDVRQITFTQDSSEKSPHLSPDGTKLIYVQIVKSTGVHTIHIMDCNGQNSQEIINGDQNVLESPQWSTDPNSSLVSYTLGDTSSGSTLWSIHIYDLSTGDDRTISGKPEKLINNRYYSWMPQGDSIVYNAGTANTGTSGFIQVPIDAPEDDSLFFDTEQVEVQPTIKLLGEKYFLTYTVINPDLSHDIYAIISSDKQVPLDGSPVKLTKTSGGTDYPVLEINSNVIYYLREGNIYKVELNTEGNEITLIPGPNTNDGEHYGDLVIGTGQAQGNPNFDIGNMVAFFPIQ